MKDKIYNNGYDLVGSVYRKIVKELDNHQNEIEKFKKHIKQIKN